MFIFSTGDVYFGLQLLITYENFLSAGTDRHPAVSEKGVLQVLLDLRFAADVLSGGRDYGSFGLDSDGQDDQSKLEMAKPSFRRNQSQFQPNPAAFERVMRFISLLSQRLDPIDWAT